MSSLFSLTDEKVKQGVSITQYQNYIRFLAKELLSQTAENLELKKKVLKLEDENNNLKDKVRYYRKIIKVERL